MKRSLTILTALTMLVGAAERAKADLMITVANSSFESPAQGSSGTASNDAITSWTHGDTSSGTSFAFGVLWPAPSYINGSVPDGTQVAYIQATGTFGQDLLTAVTPNASYTLSFYVAPRKDLSGVEAWSVQLLAGSSVIGSTTGSVTDGSATTFQQITIPATAPSNATGDLIIQFTGTTASGGQVLFDEVALSQASVPEPSTVAGAVTGVLMLVGYAWRRKRYTARVAAA